MNIIRKIKSFWQLQSSMKGLIIEAYFYLIISFILLRVIPFKVLSKRFEVEEKKLTLTPNTYKLGWDIGQSIHIASNYTPWKSLCYDRAIAAKWMLNKRRINNQLILGTLLDNNKYNFHAWIVVENQIVLNKTYKDYHTIAVFTSKFI